MGITCKLLLLLLNISYDSSFPVNRFHFSYQTWRSCRGFCLLTSSVLLIWWCHHIHGVASNSPRLCSLVSLSFWSRWLPFDSFFCLALNQLFLLPPSLWCDFHSLPGPLGQIYWSLILFSIPGIFLIPCVVYVFLVFVQMSSIFKYLKLRQSNFWELTH